MSEVSYNVGGVDCQGCVNAIERAIGSMPGVQSVHFDINAKRITVDFNDQKLKPEDIKVRIERAGYDAEQA